MKHPNDDIIIQMLKWARDNPGYNLEQLTDAFPEDYRLIKEEPYTQGGMVKEILNNANQYMLSCQGGFLLLQHEELQEARKSSRNSMIVAIVAISLTLISIVVQIILGLLS